MPLVTLVGKNSNSFSTYSWIESQESRATINAEPNA
jgi:hypothetical protein